MPHPATTPTATAERKSFASFDCRPGDVSLLPSGHDAWVIGDEAAVVVDFQGMIDDATAHRHAG
jgi:hypothetical protein